MKMKRPAGNERRDGASAGEKSTSFGRTMRRLELQKSLEVSEGGE